MPQPPSSTYIPEMPAFQSVVAKIAQEEMDKCMENVRLRFNREVVPIIAECLMHKFAIQEHYNPANLERTMVIKLP